MDVNKLGDLYFFPLLFSSSSLSFFPPPVFSPAKSDQVFVCFRGKDRNGDRCSTLHYSMLSVGRVFSSSFFFLFPSISFPFCCMRSFWLRSNHWTEEDRGEGRERGVLEEKEEKYSAAKEDYIAGCHYLKSSSSTTTTTSTTG